jgi:hypothetical protein
LNRAQQLEPVSLIEWDVPWVRRLQIGERMVPVARDQGVSHQGRTVAFTLLRRVDAEERQVPVRFTRVIAIHLLEDPRDLLLNPLGRRALQERDQVVLVRADIGWEPESGPRVTVDTVGGLVRNARPPNALTKVGK